MIRVWLFRMNKKSEKLHEQLAIIMNNTGQNIFDAVLDFCSENDLEIEDVIAQFDPVILERLKKCAISANMIRKCDMEDSTQELPLE